MRSLRMIQGAAKIVEYERQNPSRYKVIEIAGDKISSRESFILERIDLKK